MNRLLNARGQSFIEFCIISGILLMTLLLFSGAIRGRVSSIMNSFLGRI